LTSAYNIIGMKVIGVDSMQVKSETGNYYLSIDVNRQQYIVYTCGVVVKTSHHLGDVLDYMEGKING
jgi:hypothetical protein